MKIRFRCCVDLLSAWLSARISGGWCQIDTPDATAYKPGELRVALLGVRAPEHNRHNVLVPLIYTYLTLAVNGVLHILRMRTDRMLYRLRVPPYVPRTCRGVATQVSAHFNHVIYIQL